MKTKHKEIRLTLINQYLLTDEGRQKLAASMKWPMKLRWEFKVSETLKTLGKAPPGSKAPGSEGVEATIRDFLLADPEWQDQVSLLELAGSLKEPQVHRFFETLTLAEYPEDALYTFSPQWSCLENMLGTPTARARTKDNPSATAKLAFSKWKKAP